MSGLLPSALHSQKDLLFGNMPEIYQFHSRQGPHTHTHTRSLYLSSSSTVQGQFPSTWASPFRSFLQDLQGCLETPERVGSCFLQQVRTKQASTFLFTYQ